MFVYCGSRNSNEENNKMKASQNFKYSSIKLATLELGDLAEMLPDVGGTQLTSSGVAGETGRRITQVMDGSLL